jgi:hypothetical protein
LGFGQLADFFSPLVSAVEFDLGIFSFLEGGRLGSKLHTFEQVREVVFKNEESIR